MKSLSTLFVLLICVR